MKPISILYYAIALFLPLVLFLEVWDNLNEKRPLLVFVIVLPLWLGAALGSSEPGKDRIKWIGWSLFIGTLEAVGLAFLF